MISQYLTDGSPRREYLMVHEDDRQRYGFTSGQYFFHDPFSDMWRWSFMSADSENWVYYCRLTKDEMLDKITRLIKLGFQLIETEYDYEEDDDSN